MLIIMSDHSEVSPALLTDRYERKDYPRTLASVDLGSSLLLLRGGINLRALSIKDSCNSLGGGLQSVTNAIRIS